MYKNKSEVAEIVNASISEMITIVKDVEEETIRWNPAPQEWSILQIISHVEEAIPYWIRLTERILKDPSTKMERSYFSKSRLYAISEENIKDKNVEDAIGGLQKITVLVEELLKSLGDEQFHKEEVQFILDIEIVKHIEGHIHQIKRNLSNEAKVKAKSAFNFLQ